jgi:hypothetical protein
MGSETPGELLITLLDSEGIAASFVEFIMNCSRRI